MIYANYTWYSVVSLLIEAIYRWNIITHCLSLDNDDNYDDITVSIVREWIFSIKPWPKHHSIGNLISFSNKSISKYIVFNNECFINKNISKHAIILIFNQYFSSWNIQLNEYKNIVGDTIYDTLKEEDNINCSLPIKSTINWNFELLPISRIKDNEYIDNIIYVPFEDKNESLSAIIYILIILFLNISCGFITYLIYNHNKRKLEEEIEELKSVKNSINNDNGIEIEREREMESLNYKTYRVELEEVNMSLNTIPSSPTNIRETVSETPSPKMQKDEYWEISMVIGVIYI